MSSAFAVCLSALPTAQRHLQPSISFGHSNGESITLSLHDQLPLLPDLNQPYELLTTFIWSEIRL